MKTAPKYFDHRAATRNRGREAAWFSRAALAKLGYVGFIGLLGLLVNAPHLYGFFGFFGFFVFRDGGGGRDRDRDYFNKDYSWRSER